MACGIYSGEAVKKQKVSHKKQLVRNPGRSARPWPGDAQDERVRDALARELIGACMEGLKPFGLETRRLAKLAAQAATGSPDRRSRASEAGTLIGLDTVIDALKVLGEGFAPHGFGFVSDNTRHAHTVGRMRNRRCDLF